MTGPVTTADPTNRLATSPQAYLAAMLQQAAHQRLPGAPGNPPVRPLRGLNPESTDDFAVALLHAWAEVCSNLGFYHDMLSAESYLSTAADARSVRDLVELVGYRPRPASAASANVAFTLRKGDAPAAGITIRAGLPVQTMPVGAEAPQVFEVAHDLATDPEWSVLHPALDAAAPSFVIARSTLAVTVAGVRPAPAKGDGVLFVAEARPGEHPLSCVMLRTIASVERLARNAGIRLHLDPSDACGPQEITDPHVYLLSSRTRPFGADAQRWQDAPLKQRLAVGTQQGGTSLRVGNGEWVGCDIERPAFDVQCLASDSHGTTFAGTTGHGVFRLPPDGFSWEPVGKGVEKRTITAIEACGTQLFAGTDDERVFVWTPETDRWEPLGDRVQRSRHGRKRGTNHEPIPRGPVRSLVAARAWGHQLLFAGTDRGVFRWIDANKGWRGRSPGLPDWDLDTARTRINALAFDPGSLDLFAATTSGVYRTRTLGYNWHHRSHDLSVGGAEPRINDLIRTPLGRHRGVLVAALDAGVFTSSDGGRRWHQLGDLPAGLLPARCLCIGNGSRLHAGGAGGVAQWDDESGWRLVPAVSPADPNLRVDPMTDAVALTGAPEGNRVVVATPLGDLLELEWPHFWTSFPDIDLTAPKGGHAQGSIIALRNDSTHDVWATTIQSVTDVQRADFGIDRAATRHRLAMRGTNPHDLRHRFPIRHTEVFGHSTPLELISEHSSRICPVRGDRVVLAAPRSTPPGGRVVMVTGRPARGSIEHLGGLYHANGDACGPVGLAWQHLTALTTDVEGAILAQVSHAGWWRQRPGEQQWYAADLGLPTPEVDSVTFLDDGRMAATTGGSVWLRPAGGEWAALTTLQAPVATATMHLGPDGTVVATETSGLWIASLADCTWRTLARPPVAPHLALTAVAVGRGAPEPEVSQLLVATSHGEVWAGSAGGEWRLAADLPFTDVTALSAHTDGSVLVGTAPALHLAGTRGERVHTIRPHRLFTCSLAATEGAELGALTPELRRLLAGHVENVDDLGVIGGAGACVLLGTDPAHRVCITRRDGGATVSALPSTLRLAADVAGLQPHGVAGRPGGGNGVLTWQVALTEGGAGSFSAPADVAAFVAAAADDDIVAELATVTTARNSADTRMEVQLNHPLAHAYDPTGLTVNANVAEVTAGSTVRDEVLGSGDASLGNQVFTLAHPHLVYVADTDGLVSSLRIDVAEHVGPTPPGWGLFAATTAPGAERVRWTEVPDLGSAGPRDRAFQVRHSDDGRTTVHFGDGVHGARLPAGYGNVLATYRRGGANVATARPGQLSLLPQRPRGVRAVTNPLAATGGTRAERADKARVDAPLQTRCPQRIVSLQDYEQFALAYPGVGHALAERVHTPRGLVVHLTVATIDGEPLTAESPLIEHLAMAIDAHRVRPVAFAVQPATWLWLAIGAQLTIADGVDHDDALALARTSASSALAPAMARFVSAVSAADVISLLQSQPGIAGVDLLRFSRVGDEPTREALFRSLPARFDAAAGIIRPASLVAVNAPTDLVLAAGAMP